MSTQLPWSRLLYVLLRRELAEHRILFVYLPLLLAGLSFAAFTVWLIQAGGPPERFMTLIESGPPRTMTPEQAQLFTRQLQAFLEDWHEPLISNWYRMSEQAMLWTFWTSMAYYYLNTLYQSRKDRSILFWNSMPVSDAHTVLSKLLAGLVCCHLAYMLCFAALDLGIFLAVHLKVMLTDTQGFVTYVRTAVPFSNAFAALAMAPTSLVWALPVYGWLLLASAWSRQAPFAWAAGPLVFLVLIEVALTEKSLLFNKFAEHLFPFEAFELNSSGYQAPELALSALLGAALVFAAVRLNRADES